MVKYEVPEWSGFAPTNDYYMEVLKDGVIVDKIDLKSEGKSYYILGRQKESVDIWLENPTASRQHAVFQWRNDGALLCKDFHSAQGTFLNKVQLAPDTYHRIKVGDILRFAQSNRLYVLYGPDDDRPPEYDSENLQIYREKLKDRTEKQELKTKVLLASGGGNVSTGISWGMSDDHDEEEEKDDDEEDEGSTKHRQRNEEEDDEDDERFRHEKTPSFLRMNQQQQLSSHINENSSYFNLIHEKLEYLGVVNKDKEEKSLFQSNSNNSMFRGAIADTSSSSTSASSSSSSSTSTNNSSKRNAIFLEKLKLKETKIQHLLEESQRIRKKELVQPDGLTEGQSHTLSRNEEQINKLKSEINEMVEEIELKIKNSTGSTIRGNKGSSSGITSSGGKHGRNNNENDDEDDTYDTTLDTVDVKTNWRLKKKTKIQKTNHTYLQSQLIEMDLIPNDHHHTSTSAASLSYEEIKEKLSLLQANLSKIQQEKNSIQSTIHNVPASTTTIATTAISNNINLITTASAISTDSSTIDTTATDIETILLTTTTKEAINKLKKLESAEENEVEKIFVLQRLLKIVTPALPSLIHTSSSSSSVTNNNNNNNNNNNCSGTTIANSAVCTTNNSGANITSTIDPSNNIDNNKHTNITSSPLISAVTDESAFETISKHSEDKLIPSSSATAALTATVNDQISQSTATDQVQLLEPESSTSHISSSSSSATTTKPRTAVIGPSFQKPSSDSDSCNDINITGTGSTIAKIITSSIDDNNKSNKGNGDIMSSSYNAINSSTDNKDQLSIQTTTIQLQTQPPPQYQPQIVQKKVVLEGGDHVWVKPKNQTGDGKTWLNEKLGY